MTPKSYADAEAQRLLGVVHAHTAGIPRFWRRIDEFRANRGNGRIPNWPNWCYLPVAGFIAIMSEGDMARITRELISRVPATAALATWRITQGIYRFDETLFWEVWRTPVAGALPGELLQRLPEWCVYVPFPEPMIILKGLASQHYRGFWAHMEWDANGNEPELRLLLDAHNAQSGRGSVVAFMLHLKPGATLAQALQAMYRHIMAMGGAESDAVETAIREDPGVLDELTQMLEPLVSLVLYLCSATSELTNDTGQVISPRRPRPIKIKGRERLPAPPHPTTWDVGVRLGAALRVARTYVQTQEAPAEGDEADDDLNSPLQGRSVRAHIRRAHWHAFWTGPRSDPTKRKLIVKWLPAIPVGLPEELIPTIRPVD